MPVVTPAFHNLYRTLGLIALAVVNNLAWGQSDNANSALPRIAPETEQDVAAPLAPVKQDATDLLNRRLRSERVRLTAEGTLTGRLSLSGEMAVSPASQMSVALIQYGQTRARAEVDAEGNFTLKNVRAGVYTLLGAGTGGYLCLGLEAIAATDRVPVLSERPAQAVRTITFQEIRAEIEIDGLAVPPRDFKMLAELVRAQIPTAMLERASTQADTRKERAAPHVRAPLSEKDSADAAETADNVALRRHQVSLNPDGSLNGRMRRIHPQTGRPVAIRRLSVFLIQGDRIVAQSPVTEAGQFVFKNVTPGFHSFVAAGVDGLAAFGIQAADSGSVAGLPAEWELGYVSLAEGSSFGGAAPSTDPASTTAAAQTALNPANGPNGNGAAAPGADAPGVGGTDTSATGSGTGSSGGGSSGGATPPSSPNLLGTLTAAGIAAGAAAAIVNSRKKKASP